MTTTPNLKPSPELVQAWNLEGYQRVANSKDTSMLHINSVLGLMCELAAAWGAEQSAQPMDPKEYEAIMRQWDENRKLIAAGDKSSGPRDWFESVLDSRFVDLSQPAIPPGYKLARREPTQAMANAGFEEWYDWSMHSDGDTYNRSGYKAIYKAMLRASPEPNGEPK